MRKIHTLLNTLFISTSALIGISTITSCRYENKQPRLNQIDLNLPFSTLSVEEGKELESDVILVECFDQFKNKFEAQTELILKTQDNLDPPDWIRLDQNKRTLIITGSVQPATYNFQIFAQDTLTKSIHSKNLRFSIEVYKTPLLPPDFIEITTEQLNHRVCYSDSYNIPFELTVMKEEYPQEAISKECIWSITSVIGPKDDDSLFQIEYTTEGANLTVSSNIDETYIGEYTITIEAISVLPPYASDEIVLTINIVNGFEYYDEESKLTYTRNQLDQPWTLSSADPSVVVIRNMLSEIYDYPVGIIGKDFCSKSGIKLSTIIMPDSVFKIEDNAFYNQTLLYTLAMPKVKYVGDNAFNNCIHVSLSKKYDQPQLEYVGDNAFYNCSTFTLTSENAFTTIGSYAFYNTIVEQVIIGNRITTIKNNAFANCSKLTEIVIVKADPPEINGVLYSGTTNLQTIKVPMEFVEIYKKNDSWKPYKTKIVGF